MESNLTVRRRRAADMPALGSALLRVYRADGYPVEGVDDPEAWLQPAREIAAWTAVLNDEPIGQISLTQADAADDAARVWIREKGGTLADIAVVVRLFVDPNHRSCGAGRELMHAAFEHAAMLGRRIAFDVMLKDQRAIRLYEALGCERLGLITHHHSDGLEEPAAVYVAPKQVPTRSLRDT